MSRSPLPPISDYAMIGDCHGSALVSKDGSIDWCCLQRFDADPIFCRILDEEKGGYFSVHPNGDFHAERNYRSKSNILETHYHSECVSVLVTDFMPVGRERNAGTHDYVSLVAPNWIVRTVTVEKGEARFTARYKPVADYAAKPKSLRHRGLFVAAPDGPFLYSDIIDSFEVGDHDAHVEFDLKKGQKVTFVLAHRPALGLDVIAEAKRLFRSTDAFWREWSDFSRYTGKYKDPVLRSALVLKMLTYAPTGAIVAAPTMGLPEKLGGSRNFDYRYCWIRDASFTLYALSSLGYSGEAKKFTDFIQGACALTAPHIQVVYGIGGETELIERELPHLAGYKDSRPVRIGNAAFEQDQLDIYGELQEGFDVYRRLGGDLDAEAFALISRLADSAIEHFDQKDLGIWEMRSAPMHHVYSKILCWVAADRAARCTGLDKYFKAAQMMLARIKEEGIDPESGALMQAFESNEADASLLRAPLLGFPLDRSHNLKTVERVLESLTEGPFLYRYKTDDGFSGDEGAFLMCSFWRVSALLQIGEIEKARSLFDELLSRANDVGLYPEEMNPKTGEFLGNYPQALTHLAFIECAVNFQIYEDHGFEALQGTLSDRAQQGVTAASGVRGVLAAYARTGRIGRIFSSKDSKTPYRIHSDA